MDSEEPIILSQGAEAKLYIGKYQNEKCLVKERFQKNYRHLDLDKQLTKQRIRAETKAIGRCAAAGILVPRVLNFDLNNRKIFLEYYENSVTVKQFINDLLTKSAMDADDPEVCKKLEKLGIDIGQVIGRMHANHIIHGDLTTSNMLLNPCEENGTNIDKGYQLIMIDFGLASYSQSGEDKGVDLYVLERALQSAHSTVTTLFPTILNEYKKSNEQGSKVAIASFEDVRARGRKRTMVG